jgi:hypothetical protein
MATASKVLATAAREVGTKEAGKNRVKYWSLKPEWNGSAWCAAFVQWVLKVNGMWFETPLPYYVPSFEATARKTGKWISKDGKPKPGDLVIYGEKSGQHIGIFVKARSLGRIETIEGNTSSGLIGSQSNGDGVYRRVRTKSWVRGFVSMSYTPEPKPAPAPAPAPSSKPKPKPVTKPKPKPVKAKVVSTLNRGDKGAAVANLQRGLRAKFPAYARIAVDGKFGPATEKAVREFQRRTGLAVDGRVGPRTQAKLRSFGITL